MPILVDRPLMRLLVALSTSLCLLLFLTFATRTGSVSAAGASVAPDIVAMEYRSDKGIEADPGGGVTSPQEIPGLDHSGHGHDHGHDKVVVGSSPVAVPAVSASTQLPSGVVSRPDLTPRSIDRPPRSVAA